VSRRARGEVTSERIVVVVSLEGCTEDRRAAIRRSVSGAVEVLT
jgi:hypothetical protein